MACLRLRLLLPMTHPLISHYLHSRRLLDADERAAVDEASGLLREAHIQAEQIINDAHGQAADIVAQARRQADEQIKVAATNAERAAREAAAKTVAQAESSRARSLTSMDERIGVLVTRTLGKVLNEREIDEKFFSSVLEKVLRAAREEKFLTLRVCPDQFEAAQRSVDKLLEQAGATAFVEVSADSALARGACLIESEHGVIDASLDMQLDAIRRALTAVWRTGNG